MVVVAAATDADGATATDTAPTSATAIVTTTATATAITTAAGAEGAGPLHAAPSAPAIRVLRAPDGPPGYEVLLMLPGIMLDELSIKCFNSGHMLIEASPRDPAYCEVWGVRPCRRRLTLPGPVQADTAQALMTLHGQVYIRVNDPGVRASCLV